MFGYNRDMKGAHIMNNLDVRQTAKRSGVKLWQIADSLGIADSNFSKKLRYELPEEEKSKVFAVIAQLAAEAN